MTLSDHYEDMARELEEYYGALAELRAGLSVPLPQTPEILQYLEMCESNHIPLVAGGLLDQPHIFLIEANIARSKRELFVRINGAQSAFESQGNTG
jgi:hypothetical protein